MGPLGFVPLRKDQGLYLFVSSRILPLFSFLGTLRKCARSLAGDEKHESRRTVQMPILRQPEKLQRAEREDPLPKLRQFEDLEKRTWTMDVRQHQKTTLLLRPMWKEILSEMSSLFPKTSFFLYSPSLSISMRR